MGRFITISACLVIMGSFMFLVMVGFYTVVLILKQLKYSIFPVLCNSIILHFTTILDSYFPKLAKTLLKKKQSKKSCIQGTLLPKINSGYLREGWNTAAHSH